MEVLAIQAEMCDQQRQAIREKYEQEKEKEKQKRDEDKRKVYIMGTFPCDGYSCFLYFI